MQTQDQEQRKAQLSRTLERLTRGQALTAGIIFLTVVLFTFFCISYLIYYVIMIILHGFQQANQITDNDWISTFIRHNLTTLAIVSIVFLGILALDSFLNSRIRHVSEMLPAKPRAYTRTYRGQVTQRSVGAAIESKPKTSNRPEAEQIGKTLMLMDN